MSVENNKRVQIYSSNLICKVNTRKLSDKCLIAKIFRFRQERVWSGINFPTCAMNGTAECDEESQTANILLGI